MCLSRIFYLCISVVLKSLYALCIYAKKNKHSKGNNSVITTTSCRWCALIHISALLSLDMQATIHSLSPQQSTITFDKCVQPSLYQVDSHVVLIIKIHLMPTESSFLFILQLWYGHNFIYMGYIYNFVT